jgi:hypothetical protein
MASLRLTFAAMPTARRVALVATGATLALTVLILGSSVVLRSSTRDHTHRTTEAGHQESANIHGGATPSSSPDDSGALASDLVRLAAAPVVRPATSRDYPAVPDSQRAQPDMYARAFATQLLAQDYATARAELVAWVQSETVPTSEPLVVGLVPDELRPKLGVWTVTDSTDGTAPSIPTEAGWRAWAARGGTTGVEIVRVTEPAAWADAVAAGRITDPGVTARDVDAVVTTRWQDHGKTVTAKRSVFLSLTLEGPPTRAEYGYVNTVAYRSVPIGG